MKRICLVISYDGTNYNGWQTGGTGIGIETIIENTISKLLNTNIKIYGLSRTDAGVHANMNIAVFDTDVKINVEKIYYAINYLLPNDIVIKKSFEVPNDFDLRKIEIIKKYEYKIYNSKIRNPLINRYTHFVHYNIDINKMILASKYLIGQNDFRSFANPESQILKNGGNSIRNINNIEIFCENNNIIFIRITGNGFLYHMVRIICGSLLKVGMNMWDVDYIKYLLDVKNRKFAGPTLPACGLNLMKI